MCTGHGVEPRCGGGGGPLHALFEAYARSPYAQNPDPLLRAGKSAWGIELSKAVLEQEAPDLLKAGYVEAGVLTNLPYANNRCAGGPCAMLIQ